MESLLSYIIPIAFGAAISPTVLAMALAILSNPKAPKLGIWAFLVSSLAVVVIIGVVGLLLAGAAIGKADGVSANVSGDIDMVFGVLLIALGIRRLFQKDKVKKPSAENPAKLNRYFMLGIILMATNLSTLVLYFAILKELAIANAVFVSKIVILAVVILIIMLPVTIPLALHLLFPKTFGRILSPLNRFLQRNSKYVMVGIIFFFAALLIAKGLSRIF